MPPSGFNPACVTAAVTFARECISDLRREVAEGKHQDLRAAINHEQNLLYLASKMRSSEFGLHATHGSLAFVKGFYDDLATAISERDNPDEAVEAVLRQLEEELSLVHINERGRLVQRTLQPSS